ncbi:unnamed protein product [Durusdinium trenchii]|uniref:Uncharacterized protein n=1 Tax=Durusdinium trenchii TaxID=1381693 RepID=A0ABP0I988_9DINO
MAWSDSAGGFYIFGGWDSFDGFNDLYLYVHEANQWQQITPHGTVPSRRSSHSMAWSDAAGGFYIFGGTDGSDYLNDLYFYAREANLWQQITANGPAPSPRRRRSMVWSDSAGGFYIFGGYYGSELNDLYLYHHEANLWQQITANGPAPSPRRRRSMVWSDSAGGFYIFGGYDGSGRLNDLYLYHHEANQWWQVRPTGTPPGPRSSHSMAWSDAAGGFYIFGGYESGEYLNYLNDAYLYLREANQWQLITPSGTAPTPRYGHSMAWSDAAGGFYIFGGTDGSRLNDLYLYVQEVYDTSTWTMSTGTTLTSTLTTVTTVTSTLTTTTTTVVDVSAEVAAVALSSGSSSLCLALVLCLLCRRRLRFQEAARRRKEDFKLSNPLAVKHFVLYADVQLVRYEFLEEIFGAGKPWPRRQEAEEMKMEDGRIALVTRDELRSLRYSAEKRKFFQDADERVEVHLCSISHAWEAMEHPDAWRYQLQEAVLRLSHLDGLVWIFYDFTSLPQYPRTTAQQHACFHRALGNMHLLYAHDLVNVLVMDQLTKEADSQRLEQDLQVEIFIQSQGGVGLVHTYELTVNDNLYLVRGWCQAERLWANLREGVDNVVPEPPELFAKRLDTFVFTHRSDTNAVRDLQRKVFEEKTEATTKLRFDKLPPDQIPILCAALPHYSKLEILIISRTRLQETGIAAILRSRATLVVLVDCDLDDQEATTMLEILEKEATAVKQLELGRNDRISQEIRLSLTVAALKNNIKLLLKAKTTPDIEMGKPEVKKSIVSL